MIRIVEGQIDHQEIIDSVATAEAGAIVTFDGVVRNNARGKNVTRLFYEAYPELAYRELEKVRNEAMQRWPIQSISIVHRVGRLDIGESTVFIAVSAAHRHEAFDACRYAIDTLKRMVPIWKKEFYEDGEVWVEGYPEERSTATAAP